MWRIKTCDSTFNGNLSECREWFESDSFSPRVDRGEWLDMINLGKYNFGFPWGEVTLERI